jgi:hypothetical protein
VIEDFRTNINEQIFILGKGSAMKTRSISLFIIGLLVQSITGLGEDGQKAQGKINTASLTEQARAFVLPYINSTIAQNGNFTINDLKSPVPRILKFDKLQDKIDVYKGKTKFYSTYIIHGNFVDAQTQEKVEVDFPVLHMDAQKNGDWKLYADWSEQSAYSLRPAIHKINGVERCKYNEFGQCMRQ